MLSNLFGTLWPVGLLVILTIPASVYLAYVTKQWDRHRTHVVLHYELDAVEAASFQQLCAGLQALGAVARLTRVEARQVHGDWKRNAGATTSLQISPATVLPPGNTPWLETNVPVWSLRWHQGNLALIFLPDRMLIEQGPMTAAVPYSQVQITTEVSRWVESGYVPPDARVLSYTWQYTNKDGSPDRRFNGNRQLPIIEAAYVGFQHASGLNLLLQASSTERTAGFVQSFRSFRPLICAEPPIVA